MKHKKVADRSDGEYRRMISEISRLFFEAEQKQDFKTRFENPGLLRCWEHTKCTHEECPAHGSRNLRCWQIAGTHCGENIVGNRARLLEDCLECDVFGSATSDATSEMGELFNNMMFMLENKVEQILKAERQLEERVETATRELKKSQAQLIHQEKMASLGLLSSGIAHEVGNPLTSISTLVQLIQKRITDPASQEGHRQILKHIDRISKIVRELVDFSRPSHRGAEKININEVVESALGFLKYSEQSGKVRLHTELGKGLPDLLLIRDQLLQVFMNLILNAVDAMPAGGTLTVKTSWAGEWVHIDFCDTGIGVDPALKEKIFEPFFTTKVVGKGTGLGLSVSYGIIENFNGRIEVNSEPGKGSAFRVCLPALTEMEEGE
jgi:signal transduction histidine kinase